MWNEEYEKYEEYENNEGNEFVQILNKKLGHMARIDMLKVFPVEHLDSVIDLTEHGYNNAEIARELGVESYYIKRIKDAFAGCGVKLRMHVKTDIPQEVRLTLGLSYESDLIMTGVTLEDAVTVINLIESGCSMEEVSAKTGMNSSRVHKIRAYLTSKGIPIIRSGSQAGLYVYKEDVLPEVSKIKDLTIKEKRAIIQMYLEEQSIEEIAEEVVVSCDVVSLVIEKLNSFIAELK